MKSWIGVFSECLQVKWAILKDNVQNLGQQKSQLCCLQFCRENLREVREVHSKQLDLMLYLIADICRLYIAELCRNTRSTS